MLLNIPGAKKDLDANAAALRSGLRVILFTPGDIELEATLVFNQCWVAKPDFNTVRNCANQ